MYRELYYIEVGLRALVSKEKGAFGEEERVAGSQPSNLERAREREPQRERAPEREPQRESPPSK
ncbi:unnamed protein product [Prunus brigantina]